MHILFPILVTFILFSYGFSAKVEQELCGGSGKILQFRISPCRTSPCVFVAGETYTVDIYFKISRYTQGLNFMAYGVWYNNPDNHHGRPLRFGNFCDYLVGDSCPVKTGKKYHFQYTLRTGKHWPPMSLKTKLIVKDDRDNVQLCTITPFVIQNPSYGKLVVDQIGSFFKNG